MGGTRKQHAKLAILVSESIHVSLSLSLSLSVSLSVYAVLFCFSLLLYSSTHKFSHSV